MHITFQRKVELVVRATRGGAPLSRATAGRGSRPNGVLRGALSQELALYVDFKADESYTPKFISIRVGNNAQDVKVITSCGFC